ncbi:conserved hypothetical protein [Psychromonas ingrahamii 37]|uniref:Uncharacterized protein n=1 Tax=Psychromonas ingrahamii (strain DSM 17664 / CCUG 51855 / 37) TaxID=357804 RepID=A1SXI1_PSYIN|nr:WYL domain-containing protein [Psychromonas ingrahamii]ABM04196.1 conserved hypothetical protein [Psychromonas ingrahamii 37]
MVAANNQRIDGLSQLTLQRYQLIEIIAYWEGRLTTNHLCKGFDIGRQQASRFINAYLSEIAPDNLIYDTQLRGYKPADDFRPRVTNGHIEEYLNLLRFNHNLVSKNNHVTLGLRDICSVTPPPRYIEPVVIRGIVRAITEKRRVEIEYLSFENPEPEIRVIAPHSLVESPLRWHVRAYCEKNKDYRDFVLSRFINKPDLIDSTINTLEYDNNWCTPMNIILQPDPRLKTHQKALVERDYDMSKGQLVIPTRLALVNYMLSSLGLDLFSVKSQPNFQQVSIKNLTEIQGVLSQRGLLRI